MLHSRQSVLRQLLLALGLTLCTLPGCGGNGSSTTRGSSLPAIIPARSITQSFPEVSQDSLGPPPPPSTTPVSASSPVVIPVVTPAVPSLFYLQAPIDQTKPLVVTSGSVPLVQGKDYSVDAAFFDILRFTYTSPGNTLTVQYTSLPTTTQVFFLNSGSQTKFILARPVDVSKPIRIQLFPRPVSTTPITTVSTTPIIQLTAQEYTLDASNPTILEFAQAPTTPAILAVTYVPKAQ